MSADSFDTQYANALPIERAAFEDFAARTLLHDLNVMGYETAQCESKHAHPNNLMCSLEVTHRMTLCRNRGGRLVCANHVTAHVAHMDKGGRCGGCKQLASDCWRFVEV